MFIDMIDPIDWLQIHTRWSFWWVCMIGIHSMNKIHNEAYRLSIIAEIVLSISIEKNLLLKIFVYSCIVEEKLCKSIPTE